VGVRAKLGVCTLGLEVFEEESLLGHVVELFGPFPAFLHGLDALPSFSKHRLLLQLVDAVDYALIGLPVIVLTLRLRDLGVAVQVRFGHRSESQVLEVIKTRAVDC